MGFAGHMYREILPTMEKDITLVNTSTKASLAPIMITGAEVIFTPVGGNKLAECFGPDKVKEFYEGMRGEHLDKFLTAAKLDIKLAADIGKAQAGTLSPSSGDAPATGDAQIKR